MRAVLIAVGLALAVAGGYWWLRPPKHPPPVNASLYETDMIEGLVRGILPQLPPPVPPVCFLAFGDGRTSPSRQFLARFAGSQPAVRSCGSAASPPIDKYFDVYTGRQGLIVHIVSFKQFTHGTFDVLVSFSNLPPGHDRFTYRISTIAGEWTVRSRKPA
jgi:hypothetical protein